VVIKASGLAALTVWAMAHAAAQTAPQVTSQIPAPVSAQAPVPTGAAAKPVAAMPDRHYRALSSGSLVKDRNFYLFTALAASGGAREQLTRSVVLKGMAATRQARLDAAIKDCAPQPACLIEALLWTDVEIGAVAAEFVRLSATESFRVLVATQLRPSGRFLRHDALSDGELLGQSWTDGAKAMNRILRVYALGEPPLYPAIDATGLDTQGEAFKALVAEMLVVLREGGDGAVFHDLPLNFALTLLQLDDRENAAFYPALDEQQNAAAVQFAKTVDWSRYAYSAILVLGHGPSMAGQKLGHFGKLRLMHAAKLYAEGKAPFLIVSGGNVHPTRTPLNEAESMKSELMSRYGIPERAIIMEPHARHTTTNFRNAVRLMFRYGFPMDQDALVTSSSLHSQYCESDKFIQRLHIELGYLPITLGQRRSAFDLEFKPLLISLHQDGLDPLDP
jgi:DUF218 domain